MCVRSSARVVFFLALYVDGILLTGNDIPTLNSVIAWLGESFIMKDLEEAAYILGIKIYMDKSKRIIGLRQNTYFIKIMKKFKMEESNKRFVLMQQDTFFSKT